MMERRPATTGAASGRRDAALVGGLALVLLLPGIGLGYWDRDEAEYAALAREMLRSGDWVVPRLFGEPYSEKPPLAVWLTAGSFRVLGETETAGRLPHVLLAAGSAALVLVLGRRLFGARAGLRAGLILATSLLFVLCGRLLLADSSLLCFALASLAGFLRSVEGDRSWPTWLAGGMLGIATLAKGPVAWLPLLLFAAGYAAACRHRTRVLTRVAALLAASLIVSLPWFLLAARATDGRLVRMLLLTENLERFWRPMEGHRGPIVYYVAVLLLGLFPWSGLLLPVLAKLRRRQPDPALWGTIAWAGGTLAFFSLSATKLPHYLLLALPAFALLIARSAEELDSPSSWRAFAWTAAATGAILLAGGVLAVRAFDLVGAANAILIPLAAAALATLLVPLLPWHRAAFALAALGPTILGSALPLALDPARCLPRLGLETQRLRRLAEPVGEYGIHEPALGYYAACARVERWHAAADVHRALESSPTGSVLVWLQAERAAELRDAGLRLSVLARGMSLIDSARGLLETCRVTAARASPGG